MKDISSGHIAAPEDGRTPPDCYALLILTAGFLGATRHETEWRVRAITRNGDGYIVLDAFNNGSVIEILPKERKVVGIRRNNNGAECRTIFQFTS